MKTGVLPVVLVVAVMSAATAVTLMTERDMKLEMTEVWARAAPGVASVQVFDWDGDGTDDVFVQSASTVAVLARSGDGLMMQDSAPAS